MAFNFIAGNSLYALQIKFLRLNNFKFSNLESFNSKTLKSKLYPN